jgi:hypothetical protein
MTNFNGSLLLHVWTAMPPALFTSSANTSVILRQRSASVEKGPVSEIVVPKTIGSLHEPWAACAGSAARAEITVAAQVTIRRLSFFIACLLVVNWA